MPDPTTARPKLLHPVRPSLHLEAAYRKRLERMVEAMHRSLIRFVLAAYRANEPEMAQDASPASALRDAIRRLARRWQRKFNDAADELARYFAQASADRSGATLRSILHRGGWSVRFQLSRAANDVLQSIVHENVALIRSIPQQHLLQVEGIVMRSVQAGRDLQHVSDALQHQFGVTKRRAALIARDQNNKATAAITRVRQQELGIKEAIWVHSGGGKHPRPSHVKAGRDRVRYDVATGWFDPHEGRHVFPGELVNCRCVARSVVPGFS